MNVTYGCPFGSFSSFFSSSSSSIGISVEKKGSSFLTVNGHESVLLYFDHCVHGMIFPWLTSRRKYCTLRRLRESKKKEKQEDHCTIRQVLLLTNLCFIDAWTKNWPNLTLTGG